MEIKSDQENKKKSWVFTKIFNIIFKSFWRTIFLIAIPLLTYIWFILFPGDYMWLMFSAAGAVFGIGLATNGELFKELTVMMFIYVVVFLAVTGIWYGTSAQNTEVAKMDLKPLITEVKSNEDKNAFVINNKLPFESGIEVLFSGAHQYDALFVDPVFFKDFSITALKTCNTYRIKSMDCDVSIEIKHKDSSEVLFTKTLYNSVYPQKLKIEDVVE